MSAPPSGNSSVSVSAPPDSVPVSVPAFFLWHDPHVPSAGSAGSRITDPGLRSPVCVTVHLTVSGPCASVPVPVHEPVRFDAGVAALDAGVGAVGAADDAPQAASGRARTAASTELRVPMTQSIDRAPRASGHQVRAVPGEG